MESVCEYLALWPSCSHLPSPRCVFSSILEMSYLVDWLLIIFLARYSSSSLSTSPYLDARGNFLPLDLDIFSISLIFGSRSMLLGAGIGSGAGNFIKILRSEKSEVLLLPRNLRLNSRSNGPQMLRRECVLGRP